MELVTAVITTHKRTPQIVERALKSILSQTYENIEVIVVDDSPADFEQRDAVRAMVEGYADRSVSYIPHETCKGACAARNTGLAQAAGTYIAFLDDDDEWKPEKIEKQLAGFTSDRVALVYCDSETVNDTTGEVTVRKSESHSGRVYEKLIIGNFIGSTSFPLLRTQAVREAEGFDVLMQSAQDYDMWLRLAQKHEVAYVSEPLVIYHVHAGEQISKSFTKKISGMERINLKNAAYLRKDKTAFWSRTIKLVPMYAGNKQRGKALKIWLRAAATCPGKAKDNVRYLVRALKVSF